VNRDEAEGKVKEKVKDVAGKAQIAFGDARPSALPLPVREPSASAKLPRLHRPHFK